MQHRLPTLLTSLALGITFAGAALMLIGSEARAKVMPVVPDSSAVATVTVPPNPKLEALYKRLSVSRNLSQDAVAEVVKDVHKLVAANELRSPLDYALGAKILSKGTSAKDALLTHDLAVCALALGRTEVKALVASSQDQILTLLGQKQRFGTLVKDGQIVPVETGIPDAFRHVLGIPALRELKRLTAAGKPYVANVKVETLPARPVSIPVAVVAE